MLGIYFDVQSVWRKSVEQGMARLMARYDVLMLMTNRDKQSASRLSQLLFISKRRGSLDVAGEKLQPCYGRGSRRKYIYRHSRSWNNAGLGAQLSMQLKICV